MRRPRPGRGGVPPLRLPTALAGWGKETRAGPLLLPTPAAPTLSPRLSPLSDWLAGLPFRGAGPGTQYKTCPQVASWDKDGEHTPSRDPPSPSGSPGRSPLRVSGTDIADSGASFSCDRRAPRGLWAPASWALPLTEASLSPLLLAPPLVPRDSLAFPACCRTKPLFPVSPDPHLATSSPQLPRSSAPASSSYWTPLQLLF